MEIPIWPYAKLIATCWLVLPYFSGAAYVYEHYVRLIYVNPQTINIWYVPRKKDTFGKRDDILTAAEKYIQENGTDAFENLINRVFPSIEPRCSVILLCFLYPTRANGVMDLQADKSRRGGGYYTAYDETY
ncbi:hypothetical protein V8G54_017001 [Vigna mungo]|uniref:HVA22-like protein n=1 Tax=Vigna mungo TaxID=3915 RepID=A0AAQ3NP39_VIGMU